MYSQSFTPYNLYICSTQSERRNIGLDKKNFIQNVELCMGDRIERGIYQFKIKSLSTLYLNDCPKNSMEHLCQNLILRKLYNNIKRIYGIEQANRNQIVKQMKTLLQEETTKWVIRLDVRHFYESISREHLINRFLEKGRLNYQSICLLRNLFANPVIASKKGVPRGLSISSAMSELYMKYFDLEIRRMDGVFYYARFVDDIIIFCSSETAQENVWNAVPDMLQKMGLHLNPSKSYKWCSDNPRVNLTYLGYTFLPQSEKKVEIVIDQRKVNVIKTRITRSFIRFAKDGQYYMLKQRIKFLTGNFTLYNQSTLQPINIGIYFNYNMATNKEALYELDKYYQKILHCRTGRLGTRLTASMSSAERTELTKYSFVFGFDKHVNHHFTSTMLADITNCWR